MKERTVKRLLWAVTVLLLAGTLLALWATGFFEAASSPEAMEEYIDRCAPWSHLAYFAIQLASVIVAPIPSNITAAAAGWLFGVWPAFLLTWGAVALGSALVFALARGLGQGFVQRLAGERASGRYLELLRRKRDVFLLVALLFPFFPDDVLCILAGLTEIPFKRFILLVVIARPWGLLAACAVGGNAVKLPLPAMIALGALGAVLAALALKYGDRAEEAILRRLNKTEK